MIWLARLIKVVFVLLGLVLGFWFASENGQSVNVVALGYPLPSLSLGLWSLIALMVGVLLGFVVSLWPAFSLKQRLGTKERQLKNSEDELQKVRSQHVRG